MKKVLLIYSRDNEAHRKVVCRFATFLHKCCECDVSIDEWSTHLISRISSCAWLTQRIENVDKIIIIHSEGGFRQVYFKIFFVIFFCFTIFSVSNNIIILNKNSCLILLGFISAKQFNIILLLFGINVAVQEFLKWSKAVILSDIVKIKF